MPGFSTRNPGFTGLLSPAAAPPVAPAGYLNNPDFTSQGTWKNTGTWSLSNGKLLGATSSDGGFWYQQPSGFDAPIADNVPLVLRISVLQLVGSLQVVINNTAINTRLTAPGYYTFAINSLTGDKTINLRGYAVGGVNFSTQIDWLQLSDG